MNIEKLYDRVVARIIAGLLMIFAVFQLVLPLFDLGDYFPGSWEFPVILASLAVVVGSLPILRNLDEKVGRLAAHLGRGEIQRYDRYRDFYDDLRVSARQASRSLELTHVRPDPPKAFSKGQKYFEQVERWARNHKGEGTVRRLISLSSLEMKEWATELAKVCEELNNFEVRVIDWSMDFPMINMAIIDAREVYLALTPRHPHETVGMRVVDPGLARHFQDYFFKMFNSGEPVTNCVGQGAPSS